MILYLVQHGEALPENIDPDRSLTPEGRRNVEAVADFLAKAGIKKPVIFHSGKTRALQTAGLIADALKVDNVVSVTGLAPNDDVSVSADFIEHRNEDTLVVGHLPHLEKFASLLTTGKIDTVPVALVNAGVLCLKKGQGGYRIGWYLTPELCRDGMLPLSSEE